jgi:hypothetical protein
MFFFLFQWDFKHEDDNKYFVWPSCLFNLYAIKWNQKNTTMSEQFQNPVERGKSQTPTQKTWRRTFPALLCYMYLTPQWIILGLVQRQPTEKTTATGYRSRTYFLRCVEQSLIKDINMKITAWYTKPGDQKPQFKERQTIQWANEEGQKTNNDSQNNTRETKDWNTRTTLTTQIFQNSNSHFTSSTRDNTLVTYLIMCETNHICMSPLGRNLSDSLVPREWHFPYT